MSHLDEGTLHALLDGELDLREVAEIQAHLGTCAACGARLQEVKQFLAESDRLVGALEIPAGAGARAAAPPARPSPPPRSAAREPQSWDEPPVLLLPDNVEALVRRRRILATIRWAAIVVLVLGGGRLLMSVVGRRNSLPAASDIATATRAAPPPVVSPEETSRPAQPAAAPAPTRVARTPAQNRTAPARTTVPQSKAAAAPTGIDSSPQAADTQTPAVADSATSDQTLAATAPAESTAGTVARDPDTVPRDLATKARPDGDAATRRAAAEALAELDRQRQRQRAAAATAAIQPPAQPRAEAPAPETPAPPPPKTAEQRAQVYTRIGLDEAARQLGRPVHVIEGMTPEFIGLTYGRLVAGADPNRPVVRVVYVDSRGRMILLDQQRIRSDQAPGGAEGNLRWTVGDVMLYLRGEPGPDVLRTLQRRVR